MDALHWLKKYNRHYKDIEIEPSNLNWMNNDDEAELPNDENEKLEYETEEEMKKFWNDHLVNGIAQNDHGPAKSQVTDVEDVSDDITYRFQGAVCNQFANKPSKKE